MWYISFHGGSGGINNILVYHDSGKQHTQPDLLPTGGSNPTLKELRGFVLDGSLLYVVNAYKQYSQVLTYRESGGVYSFQQIYASSASVNSILHPYDISLDGSGNSYVSSQDTNVITGLQAANTTLPIAGFLQQQYPPPDVFLSGTQVSSSIGDLPNTPLPSPPDVAAPQGLSVSFTDSSDTRVGNSVRGVLFHNGYLFVSDEPGNTVNIYAADSGELSGQIAGGNLVAPVQLLLGPSGNELYIGSSGNDSVVRYDLRQGIPTGTVVPETFINGHAKHVSGMAFDADGNFYVAERKAQKIKQFPPDGSGSGKDFITGLPDNPEFIRYVPKQ